MSPAMAGRFLSHCATREVLGTSFNVCLFLKGSVFNVIEIVFLLSNVICNGKRHLDSNKGYR